MTLQQRTTRTVRRDAARNQELVVRAAREVISELGTDASIEQVASRAGVGVGTVYRHFANKDALIDELVRLYLDELIDQARADLARDDGTGLESFLRALGRSFVEHSGYAEHLAGHSRSDDGAILLGLMAELTTQAQRHGRIGAWVTIGDIRATTWALRGIVQTTATVAPHAWERHLDIQLMGLRAPQPSGDRSALTGPELARITAGDGSRPAAAADKLSG